MTRHPLRPLLALLGRPEVKALVRAGLGVARRLAPTRSHVVVTAFPDTEGNAVEVLRLLLAADAAGDVVWLTEELDATGAARALDLPSLPSRLRVVPKRSVAGLLAFLTARLTFFTHGLYLSPAPPARKPVVNLWHGDGPKAPLRDRRTTPPRATVLVSGTRRFGEIKARFLHVPLDDLLGVGNPRQDQLTRPVDDAALRTLGLDPARPFVAYLPTFRSSVTVGSRVGWQDTAASAAAYSSRDMLAGLVAGAREAGVQVLVKPHPLDAESYAAPGAVQVTSGQLDAAGVPLYALLGRSVALVTDYSSVWTDYLTLDRPIGFVLHDLDDYVRGSRGLNVTDLGELLPGPSLLSPDDCVGFVKAAVHDPEEHAELRAASARLIGLAAPGTSAAGGLLGELSRRGLL